MRVKIITNLQWKARKVIVSAVLMPDLLVLGGFLFPVFFGFKFPESRVLWSS